MTKGADYTVTKKTEVTRVSPAGEPVLYLRIHALSKGGTPFQLEIPEDQIDQADALLTAKAKKLDAI